MGTTTGGGVQEQPGRPQEQQQQQQQPTTDEKRAYLRRWALERAEGDPAHLPVIREARAAVRAHFGEAPGAGLGTDIITGMLRELRSELLHGHDVGQITIPTEQMERLSRLARIIQLMREEKLGELAIDQEGAILSMRRFGH